MTAEQTSVELWSECGVRFPHALISTEATCSVCLNCKYDVKLAILNKRKINNYNK